MSFDRLPSDMQQHCRYAQYNRLQTFPSELLRLPRLEEMYVLLYDDALSNLIVSELIKNAWFVIVCLFLDVPKIT